MYLYRALNNNDISALKLNEGLYSKDDTEYIKKRVVDFILYADEDLFKQFSALSKEEQKDIYKTYIHNFAFNIKELKDLSEMKLSKVNICNMKNLTNEQKQNIIKVLSTINTHLIHGSRVDTSWISFTSDIHKIEKYYLSQSNNKVAVIDSNVNLIIDKNAIAVDLSSKDEIKKLSKFGFLISKDFNPCSYNFRGYNNSAKDNEVIYYSHVPQEKVVTVLEPIQIDLIYNNIFNEKFYQLSNYSKCIIYEMFKSSIKVTLFDNLSDIERMIYFEHYINCKSLSSLSSNNYDLQKLIAAKKKILSQIKINSCTKYMMNDTFKNIVLPEEKKYSK